MNRKERLHSRRELYRRRMAAETPEKRELKLPTHVTIQITLVSIQKSENHVAL